MTGLLSSFSVLSPFLSSFQSTPRCQGTFAVLEKYSSPGHKRTYLADLPAGYHGQFGPKVRAWVVAMYYAGQMSEPKILEVLQTAGMQISAGCRLPLTSKRQDRVSTLWDAVA